MIAANYAIFFLLIVIATVPLCLAQDCGPEGICPLGRCCLRSPDGGNDVCRKLARKGKKCSPLKVLGTYRKYCPCGLGLECVKGNCRDIVTV